MASSLVATFVWSFLILGPPLASQTYADFHFHNSGQTTKNLERRSIVTFPPDSLLQINMGITLSGQFERNSAAVVLGFQQNGALPSHTLPLVAPSLVVTARKFSVFDHLQQVLYSYGYNGSECLRKMVCQVGETPLLGGLLEDVVSFVLSPSRHRSVQESPSYLRSLLEAERVGKLGGNCTVVYPLCSKTPLDLVSAVVRV